MKVALFALFLLVVAGCNSVAASGTSAPKVDDAARDRCIFAIVQALDRARMDGGQLVMRLDVHSCKPYFPVSWADPKNPY